MNRTEIVQYILSVRNELVLEYNNNDKDKDGFELDLICKIGIWMESEIKKQCTGKNLIEELSFKEKFVKISRITAHPFLEEEANKYVFDQKKQCKKLTTIDIANIRNDFVNGYTRAFEIIKDCLK
jgi:hypothetical protein